MKYWEGEILPATFTAEFSGKSDVENINLVSSTFSNLQGIYPEDEIVETFS